MGKREKRSKSAPIRSSDYKIRKKIGNPVGANLSGKETKKKKHEAKSLRSPFFTLATDGKQASG